MIIAKEHFKWSVADNGQKEKDVIHLHHLDHFWQHTDEIADVNNLPMWLTVNGKKYPKQQYVEFGFQNTVFGALFKPVYDFASR